MVKKKLSKGFDDLFSQNETDLSFLDAYGKTDTEHLVGLPESSQNPQSSNDLFEAIIRLFKSEDVDIKSTKNKISLGNYISINKKKDHIKISINSKKLTLPLVPSDLMAPGFIESELSEDSKSCSLIINSWGIASKRFITRMIEFYKNNY